MQASLNGWLWMYGLQSELACSVDVYQAWLQSVTAITQV